MTGTAIILTHLVALTTPLLSIDTAALCDEVVTQGRQRGHTVAIGITATIISPPVPLLKATRSLVSDGEPDDQRRVAVELDRASRALLIR